MSDDTKRNFLRDLEKAAPFRRGEYTPFFTLKEDKEILELIGTQAAINREHKKLSKEEVATKADISVEVLQKFEEHGDATLADIIKIGRVLDALAGFEKLFPFSLLHTPEELKEYEDFQNEANERREETGMVNVLLNSKSKE